MISIPFVHFDQVNGFCLNGDFPYQIRRRAAELNPIRLLLRRLLVNDCTRFSCCGCLLINASMQVGWATNTPCVLQGLSLGLSATLCHSRHSRLIDPTGINHRHPPYSIRKLSSVGHTFWPHILIYGHSLIRGVVWTCLFLFPIIFVQHLIVGQLLIKFILPLQSHQSWWPQISHISAVYCHFQWEYALVTDIS